MALLYPKTLKIFIPTKLATEVKEFIAGEQYPIITVDTATGAIEIKKDANLTLYYGGLPYAFKISTKPQAATATDDIEV